MIQARYQPKCLGSMMPLPRGMNLKELKSLKHWKKNLHKLHPAQVLYHLDSLENRTQMSRDYRLV
jgi:hypothetical protein